MNATRINLINGQKIETAEITASPTTHRTFNLVTDAEQFPQADRQLGADEVLIVDRNDGSSWAIDANDAAECEVGDVIEVFDGQFIATRCF